MESFATRRAHDGPARAHDAGPDVDAEHDPAIARRTSLALLRREEAAIADRVGVDPAGVTVGEDPAVAAQGAHAVTRGSAIDFAPGAYAPGTERGRALLGHELAHVAQQRRGAGGELDDAPALEGEADQLGVAAARGEHVAGALAGRAAPQAAQYSFGVDLDAIKAGAAEAKRAPKPKAKKKDASAGTQKVNDHHVRLHGYAEGRAEAVAAFAAGLDDVVAMVGDDKRATLYVQGHTDADEEPTLGAERAKAIELLLRGRGLHDQTIHVGNSAHHSPLADESKSRRVEVTVVRSQPELGISRGKGPGLPELAEQPPLVGHAKDTGEQVGDTLDVATSNDPLVGPVWDGVKDTQYIHGLASGLIEGLYKAATDFVSDFQDAGKLLAEIIVELFSGDVLGKVKSGINRFADMLDTSPADAEAAVKGVFLSFLERWNNGSSYEIGRFRGVVVGYMAATIAIFAASLWSGSAAAQAGRFAEIARMIQALDVGSQMASAVSKGSSKLGKLISKLGKDAGAADDLGGAAGKGAHVADDVADVGDAASESKSGTKSGEGDERAPGAINTHEEATSATEGRSADATATQEVTDAKPARVDAPVPHLYEDLDSDAPRGWAFEDQRTTEGSTTTIKTIVSGPDGEQGWLERSYDAQTNSFTMSNAFLDELPRWIAHGGTTMTKKGTPTVAFLTMRQMRLLDVDYGALKKVKMSTIQNFRAIIELHVMRQRGIDPDIAVRSTHSVVYADTTIVQSGHKIVDAKIVGKRQETTLDYLMEHYETGGVEGGRRDEAVVKKHDKLIEEYGHGAVDRDTVVWWDYDIELSVAPFHGEE